MVHSFKQLQKLGLVDDLTNSIENVSKLFSYEKNIYVGFNLDPARTAVPSHSMYADSQGSATFS